MTAIDATPVSGSLGARLSGVDLTDLDGSSIAALRAAIVEHEVVFVREAFLDREQHLALGEALLSLLNRHVDDARFQCRWRWTPGDVAIWDERSTNHRSAADQFPQEREIRRCEVGGARPVGVAG